MITTDEFIQNFESKTQTDVVVLDFSKAFDVVPHQRLLHKLDHYGIRGATLNWIQHFLTNRTQKVVVDGSSSESGVPQGTVLGPLLFTGLGRSMWDMLQPLEMLGPEGVQAKIKKPGI